MSAVKANAPSSDSPTMMRIFFQGVAVRSCTGNGGGRMGASDEDCSFSFISFAGHFGRCTEHGAFGPWQ